MNKRNHDIERFKQYLRRQAPKRRTWIDYTSDVRQFAAACSKPWIEVTMQDIDTFVDQQRQKGLSAATVRRRVAALKVFFDFWAEESGNLSRPNPVRFKRHAGKKPKRLPRDLTDEQIERLRTVIEVPRDRAWFALMLRAGLRVGEVVSLKMGDLLTPPSTDQPARVRVYGKGEKERVVLLTADAYAVLEEWIQARPQSDSDHIFLNRHGKPITSNGIQWLLRRYGQAVETKATPHQLRHTFARQLTEGGMPLTSLGKLLGHAQVTTTQIYTAGADPKLAQAYQTAMTRLSSAPSTAPERLAATQASPESQPMLDLAPVPVPPVPDWEAWAPDLPPALRQASLAYVQRQVPTWKAQRRRRYAQENLGQLRRFWEWQLNQRSISQLSELNLSDLQAYQAARRVEGRAAATIKRTLNGVLGLLREQADRGEKVDASVFRLQRLPIPDALPRHLSEAQIQRLEAFVGQRLDTADPIQRLENACLLILAHTGLRAGELIDLQYQDLDLSSNRLIVRQGKGQRDRVVYLSVPARQAVERYLSGQTRPPMAPLWTRPNGKPINYGWIRNHIPALGQAAGVTGLTAHRLRHTLATRLLNVGMDITAIQKLLGHEYITSTQIYARVLDTTVEDNYRQAMHTIELQQMPLAQSPILVSDWPTEPLAQPETGQPGKELSITGLDNSV
jgi:site-specific recombinase XerD